MHHIRHDWSQSHINQANFFGMLTFARSFEAVSAQELADIEPRLCWLTPMIYAGFYPFLAPKLINTLEFKLTPREQEILRWTADGKSVTQIAEILVLSERSIQFHFQHIMDKLGTANKTAATVKAVLLGLLD